jgi:hypothetical protein
MKKMLKSFLPPVIIEFFLSIESVQYIPEPFNLFKRLLDQQFRYLVFERNLRSTNFSTVIVSHQQTLLKENSPVMYVDGGEEQILYSLIYLPQADFCLNERGILPTNN